MAKQATFTISSKDKPKVEVTANLPESVDDPRWEEIVSDYPNDINNLALKAWVVGCQAGARQRLDAGAEAVQNFVDKYVFGARGPGITPTLSSDQVSSLGFTEEQLAALRAAGMAVPGE